MKNKISTCMDILVKLSAAAVVGSILVFILLLAITSPTEAATGHNEAYYATLDCTAESGVSEMVNSDGTRTDCYTERYSIEHDFAKKWYECLSQAMHYAHLNKNQAICRLIVITPNDYVLADRAREHVKHYCLPVLIQLIEDPQ